MTLKDLAQRCASFLLSPYVGLTTAALLWSGNFVVGRALRDQISPLTLNFWRWLIALAVLLLFTHGALWLHRSAIWREWKLLSALGLTGIATFHTFVYLALVTTSAVNALLLLAMAPLLTVFGAWLVFRDPVTAKQLLGLIVSLTGALSARVKVVVASFKQPAAVYRLALSVPRRPSRAQG